MGGGGQRRPASTADPAIPSVVRAHACRRKSGGMERELHRIQSALERLAQSVSVRPAGRRPDPSGSPPWAVIQDDPCEVLPGGGLRQEVAAAPRSASSPLSPAALPTQRAVIRSRTRRTSVRIQVQERCNRRQVSRGLGTPFLDHRGPQTDESVAYPRFRRPLRYAEYPAYFSIGQPTEIGQENGLPFQSRKPAKR
jgi:hypothetical protein